MGNAVCVVQAQGHVHSATGSGLLAGFAGSSLALAVEIDTVGVIDQAVEDGVGVGGVADQRVPLIDGKLAGYDGGAAWLADGEDRRIIALGMGSTQQSPPCCVIKSAIS